MAGTPISVDDIETIRDQAVDILVSETAAPTGNSGYYVDYLLGLTKLITWCEQQRLANMPYDVRSQGFTAGGR
jgi:hypothetical protein